MSVSIDCLICKEPIVEFPDCCLLHKTGCEPDEIAGCDCNIFAHRGCCPECNQVAVDI